MIRILHTSDWHLGASLKGVSRDADHAKFLEWLAATLREREIDVLVIAGDVFDHRHPSAEALRLYYSFLRTIARTHVRHVVVVGGNHDSAARLDAPRELLHDIRVHVVGGLEGGRDTWASRCVHPIRNAEGAIEAIVLAVPYVHESWLDVRTLGETPKSIALAYRAAFTDLYASLVDAARALSDSAPILATGHLAVAGTSRDDAPLEVHVFGSDALDNDIFDARIAYVALGHIHRMGRQGDREVWYPGSPIALTRGEAESPRHVLMVEIDGATRVTPVRVPTFRELLQIRGPLAEVIAELRKIAVVPGQLGPFAFVTVTDAVEPQQATREVRSAAPKGVQILDLVFTPSTTPLDVTVRPEPPARLSDLDPEDVFRRLIASQKTKVLTDELLAAFREVVAHPHDEEPR